MSSFEFQRSVEILRDEVVATPWASFHRAACLITEHNGTSFRQERDFIDRGDAVAVLPYCVETQSVLLVRQFRLPVYFARPKDAMTIEVCGGMVQGMDMEMTLRKEAKEEMGIDLRDLRKVFSAYSSPGSLTERITSYLATYDHDQDIPVRAGNAHEDERIEVLQVAFTEALQWVAQGTIQDTRTIALLSYLGMELAAKTQYP